MNTTKTYPSVCKRTCLINEIAGLKTTGQIFLCGRLVLFNPQNRCGELRDWSGIIKVKVPIKSVNLNIIHRGDIVQLGGKLNAEGVFDANTIKVLTPFQKIKPERKIPNNTRWKALQNNPVQFNLLRFRSDFLNTIRHFFLEQGFIEIDAPSLIPAAGMEPHIEPFVTRFKSKSGEQEKDYFLHTSPEFAMKKMLVAGYEKIFYLGHAFRNEELSALHNPEFAMLEWYRAYEDYSYLMKDCRDLIDYLKNKFKRRWRSIWRKDDLLERALQVVSLTDVMKNYCQFDLTEIGENDSKKLLKIVRSKGLTNADASWPMDDLFFLLFLQFVEPNLGKTAATIVKDYPIWMASLAKRKSQNPNFVERFELYIDSIELANAFTELNDPDEQYQRLLEEQKLRGKLYRTEIPIDMDFIRALQVGMPPSAGIALGVDRLLMVCTNQKKISDVSYMSF